MYKPTLHEETCKPLFPLMCYHKYKAAVWKLNYYSKLISHLNNNYETCKEIRQESHKMFIECCFYYSTLSKHVAIFSWWCNNCPPVNWSGSNVVSELFHRTVRQSSRVEIRTVTIKSLRCFTMFL